MSDDGLMIDAALAGDTAAFGRLVERYQDRLYNALVRVLGSAEDARDVVQEAFVQAFVKLDTFRGSAAFYTWLYRIAFNLAMSHARREKRAESLEAAKSACGSEPVDGQPTPEAELARRDEVRLVQTALAALRAEHREVLVLRELEGCRYDEIAEILALPVGTVRSRLFRARLELRGVLAPVMEREGLQVADCKLQVEN